MEKVAQWPDQSELVVPVFQCSRGFFIDPQSSNCGKFLNYFTIMCDILEVEA